MCDQNSTRRVASLLPAAYLVEDTLLCSLPGLISSVFPFIHPKFYLSYTPFPSASHSKLLWIRLTLRRAQGSLFLRLQSGIDCTKCGDLVLRNHSDTFLRHLLIFMRTRSQSDSCSSLRKGKPHSHADTNGKHQELSIRRPRLCGSLLLSGLSAKLEGDLYEMPLPLLLLSFVDYRGSSAGCGRGLSSQSLPLGNAVSSS